MKASEPGNTENIEGIIYRHKPRLESFIKHRVATREDAEDILQDVFYQLLKNVDNAADPIRHATAWLYRVARNTIINRGKKKREESLPATRYDDEGNALMDYVEILLSDSGNDPESDYLRSLVWEELEAALTELPEEQREAFELLEMAALPAKEVAESLGVPLNTILSRKHYAVKFLRRRLESLYGEILSS